MLIIDTLPYSLLALLAPSPSLAWSLHNDCSAYADALKLAVPEAIDIATYAAGRANDQHILRKGTLMQDMIGAPNENDADSLRFVAEWMGKVSPMAGTFDSSSPESGLIIHCSDEHLKLIDPTNRVFRDQTPGRGSARVEMGARNGQDTQLSNPNDPLRKACGGVLQGFEYTFDGTNKGNVIVLCTDWNGGALKSAMETTFGGWRVKGDLRRSAAGKPAGPNNAPAGLDFFNQVLSYKILHELMHATNEGQFPGRLPDLVNNQRIKELYSYFMITGKPVGTKPDSGAPSINNRRHNADSMALLACGWYLPLYAWEHGVCMLVGKNDRPPLTYPGSSSKARFEQPTKAPKKTTKTRTASSQHPLTRTPKNIAARAFKELLKILHS